MDLFREIRYYDEVKFATMYIVLACRIRGTTNFPQLLQIGRWITYLWHQRYLREIIFLPVHVLCFVWDWTGSKYSDLGRISSLPWQFVSYGVEPQYVFLSECFKLIFVWIGPLITIWEMKNFIVIFFISEDWKNHHLDGRIWFEKLCLLLLHYTEFEYFRYSNE